MTQINAYIGFNGRCREAMNFYKECLGGTLTLQPVAGSPMEAHCPASMKDSILHSSLAKDGLLLMATDMVSPEGYTKGNNIGLSLNCSNEEEINTFYNALSADGKIVEALKEQFWGAIFGTIVDKYGITWMLHYDKNQQ